MTRSSSFLKFSTFALEVLWLSLFRQNLLNQNQNAESLFFYIFPSPPPHSSQRIFTHLLSFLPPSSFSFLFKPASYFISPIWAFYICYVFLSQPSSLILFLFCSWLGIKSLLSCEAHLEHFQEGLVSQLYLLYRLLESKSLKNIKVHLVLMKGTHNSSIWDSLKTA